jgi:N-acetylglucosamine kinase-like BadF-type ATPase
LWRFALYCSDSCGGLHFIVSDSCGGLHFIVSDSCGGLHFIVSDSCGGLHFTKTYFNSLIKNMKKREKI